MGRTGFHSETISGPSRLRQHSPQRLLAGGMEGGLVWGWGLAVLLSPLILVRGTSSPPEF